MFAIAALVIFLSVSIGVGIWAMRRTSTLGDFFLGGRSLGPWVSAFAYGTTYFSAVLFIGFAGRFGWGFGLNALWIAAGNVLFGCLLAWLVLGRRTRRMSQNLDAMTMPEFFGERFGSTYLKLASSIVIFVFLLPYCASVFKGLGHLFETQFNMPYDFALLLMVGVTGIYLVLGGYLAITINDAIQGVVMIGGAIAMVWILNGQAGGLDAAATVAAKYAQHVPEARQPSLLLIVSLVFMTSFGPWGLPQMVQKFYSIKNEGMILKAAIATTVFAAIISFSAYYCGALTHVFFDAVPMVNGKPMFDKLIPDLLSQYLPAGLMVLVMLLILSASMSTLSSLVLVSASAVAIDLYKGHVNPSVSKENSLLMMRFLSAVFIAIAYFIAKDEYGLIVTLMSLSWGTVAGTFMAPYILGLYWKRTTRLGVEVGGTCGLVSAVVLFFVMGPAKAPMSASIAMLVPFVVVPLVSLMSRPPEQAVIDKAYNGIGA